MFKYHLASVLALLLASCNSLQEASEPQAAAAFPTVHIELDKSDSPKFATDQAFAKSAATRIANDVANLPIGTFVSVGTFGELNGDNNLRYRKQITRKSSPPKMVARDVAKIIMAQAGSGTVHQGSTEIITTLTKSEYDCAKGDAIWMLTDAIESGRVKSPAALLEGDEPLPAAPPGALEGCEEVRFYGFARTSGIGLSSQHADHLQTAWEVWMDQAGVRFRAIINP